MLDPDELMLAWLSRDVLTKPARRGKKSVSQIMEEIGAYLFEVRSEVYTREAHIKERTKINAQMTKRAIRQAASRQRAKTGQVGWVDYCSLRVVEYQGSWAVQVFMRGTLDERLAKTQKNTVT